jgi:hypothetical protein
MIQVLDSGSVIQVLDLNDSINLSDSSALITISDGLIGIQGAPGEDGTDVSYVHTQSSALSIWTVNHNLGFKPSVEILSTGGAEIEGEVVHVSNNQLMIYFVMAVAGEARCN